MIDKKTRDKIIVKALQEIDFARNYKQGIIWRWQQNENLFYGKKFGLEKRDNQNIGSQSQLEARSNVSLGKMKSFVRSLLSKIDSPLTFEYQRGTIADLKKAELLNALKERDANLGDWNEKDLAGKEQLVLYDRAIFNYYADSYNGYCSHLDNVDVYDFLIDPAGGGLDLDKAKYMGRYGVEKNKQQIKDGVKNGLYIKTEATELLSGAGNNTQITQEEINKQNRYSYVGTLVNRTLLDTNIYKFWEWFTTWEGERYYILLSEDYKRGLRVEKLKDIFRVNPLLGDAMWPFWSYASLIDLTEFWTPSYADGVREVFMAQDVTINQMLDNAEQINKPQRGVDVNAVESLADLVYKRNGIVRFKPGTNINNAFKILETASIDTPLKTYDVLEKIQQIESGVTSGVKGDSDEDKVGIYEGNMAQAADQFGLLNKSYSKGYKRFGKLYWYGIEDHLTKKVAVKILGSQGEEKTVFVSRKDVKPTADYEILIKSTNAEAQSDNIKKRNQIQFLSKNIQNPVQNQKIAYELEAEIVGLDKDQIRSLMDIQGEGTAHIISEAERDIISLLEGKIIEPNMNANVAYANYFINYMKDHQEDMSEDKFLLFKDYTERLEPVIVRNMGTQLTNQLAKQGQMQTEEINQQPIEGETEMAAETNEI